MFLQEPGRWTSSCPEQAHQAQPSVDPYDLRLVQSALSLLYAAPIGHLPVEMMDRTGFSTRISTVYQQLIARSLQRSSSRCSYSHETSRTGLMDRSVVLLNAPEVDMSPRLVDDTGARHRGYLA